MIRHTRVGLSRGEIHEEEARVRDRWPLGRQHCRQHPPAHAASHRRLGPVAHLPRRPARRHAGAHHLQPDGGRRGLSRQRALTAPENGTEVATALRRSLRGPFSFIFISCCSVG